MTNTSSEAAETHAAPPEAWDAIADGYDRYVAPQEAELAGEALRLVGLAPGERFLDVAAGTGGLSLPAAHIGAEVLATDWSPAMIDRFTARERGKMLDREVERRRLLDRAGEDQHARRGGPGLRGAIRPHTRGRACRAMTSCGRSRSPIRSRRCAR